MKASCTLLLAAATLGALLTSSTPCKALANSSTAKAAQDTRSDDPARTKSLGSAKAPSAKGPLTWARVTSLLLRVKQGLPVTEEVRKAVGPEPAVGALAGRPSVSPAQIHPEGTVQATIGSLARIIDEMGLSPGDRELVYRDTFDMTSRGLVPREVRLPLSALLFRIHGQNAIDDESRKAIATLAPRERMVVQRYLKAHGIKPPGHRIRLERGALKRWTVY